MRLLVPCIVIAAAGTYQLLVGVTTATTGTVSLSVPAATYEVRSVIETLADSGSVLELRRHFGVGMVTALIRIEGRPIGGGEPGPHGDSWPWVAGFGPSNPRHQASSASIR
jgi:hypothetical protein